MTGCYAVEIISRNQIIFGHLLHIVALTNDGLTLREQALAIPEKVGGCLPLAAEDTAKLYSLLHQLMEKLS